MTATVSYPQARAIYDRIGKLQDTQSWYEDRAVDALLAHGDFARARSVVELGSGTGRHAARLLERMPPDARYRGFDVSPKMAAIARARLAPWADRAEVVVTDGAVRLDAPDRSVDRVLSTYVLDLLAEADIVRFVDEAHRVLAPGGRLCLAGAAPGDTVLGRLVMGAVTRLHRLRPSLVGGCRPIDLRPFVAAPRWRVVHVETITVAGIASQALVAEPA